MEEMLKINHKYKYNIFRQIMDEWKIVKSKSGNHPESGYPLGQVLCRDQKEAEEKIKEWQDSGIKDGYIEKYDQYL